MKSTRLIFTLIVCLLSQIQIAHAGKRPIPIPGGSSSTGLRPKTNASGLIDYLGALDANGNPLPYAPTLSNPSSSSQNVAVALRSKSDPYYYLDNSPAVAQAAECDPQFFDSIKLSQTKSIYDSFGCKVDGVCEYKRIFDELSDETGLPNELIYAIAAAQSGWNHWDGKFTYIQSPGLYGLMQVSDNFTDQTDWRQITNDPLYNARFATNVLVRSAWITAKTMRPDLYASMIKHHKTNEFYRAVYGVYVYGPENMGNYAFGSAFDETFPDTKFQKVLSAKPWKHLEIECKAF